MARVCEVLGKKTATGNNVSHSNIKTRRKFYPNLQKKILYISEKDFVVEAKVSTKALRTMNKNGILETLRKAKKRGTLSESLCRVLKNVF